MVTWHIYWSLVLYHWGSTGLQAGYKFVPTFGSASQMHNIIMGNNGFLMVWAAMYWDQLSYCTAWSCKGHRTLDKFTGAPISVMLSLFYSKAISQHISFPYLSTTYIQFENQMRVLFSFVTSLSYNVCCFYLFIQPIQCMHIWMEAFTLSHKSVYFGQ